VKRSARFHLYDINTNIAVIVDVTKGRTRNHLENDTAFRYVVLHALMIIAEAVRHLPEELLAPHTSIPWKDLVSIGEVITDDYHQVDLDMIWNAANVHVRALRVVIKQMLAEQIQPALAL
jgi:uncharacterized protein with HEPN domain